jgi:hypothetical protein
MAAGPVDSRSVLQIHPIDLTKTRLQLVGQSLEAGAAKPSALSVARSILAAEGVSGLYAG